MPQNTAEMSSGRDMTYFRMRLKKRVQRGVLEPVNLGSSRKFFPSWSFAFLVENGCFSRRNTGPIALDLCTITLSCFSRLLPAALPSMKLRFYR
tara:strand:+ start:594366 stop:594647 length:282 start_codon:yes stop_codon:yes gene_type:complete